jgi:hypothetical protein
MVRSQSLRENAKSLGTLVLDHLHDLALTRKTCRLVRWTYSFSGYALGASH